MVAEYIAYATMSGLVAGLPGPSNLVAATNGAKQGLFKASIAITGHMLAVFLLAVMSTIGLSALLVQSQILFLLVQWLGCAYLIYLGGSIIRRALLDLATQKASSAPSIITQQIKKRALWSEQFAIAISNPKALIFFTALFPQFIDQSSTNIAQIAPFIGISLCSAFLFPFIYALLGNKIAKLGFSEKTKANMHIVVGFILLLFALALII